MKESGLGEFWDKLLEEDAEEKEHIKELIAQRKQEVQNEPEIKDKSI